MQKLISINIIFFTSYLTQLSKQSKALKEIKVFSYLTIFISKTFEVWQKVLLAAYKSKQKATAILSLVSILFFGNVFAQTNDPLEVEQIKGVLMDYIEGTANGQPRRLRNAFHPNFNLYSVSDADSLQIWAGKGYINNFKEGEKNSRVGRIISIDQENNAAVAKVEVIVPGWRIFTDYFLLLKYLGNWKIVHKSFTWKNNEDKLGREKTIPKIENIFDEFNNPNHPAVAALVINEGEVIYKKAFGSENLESVLQKPARIHSKFQVAGLSKHFTAFAVLLLEEQGKITLNDDIRKYLPELPEYNTTITIDYLLSMTSGFPDVMTLKTIAGWNPEDVFTQKHALGLIKNCELGFTPGEDYIYSDTDLLLIAEIICRTSGGTFAEFLKKELFEPLGMKNTFVNDGTIQIAENEVTSYVASTDGYLERPLSYNIIGASNIYSTIDDLSKWELNLLNPKVGSAKLVEKLYTACKMSNGKTMNPTFGTLTYGHQLRHKERGILKMYQTGVGGGFTSSIFKFREQDFAVIVLSSGIPYNGYLGMQTANLFFNDQYTEPATTDFKNLKTKKLSNAQLQKYTGKYWNERSGYSRVIALKDDTLRYVRSNGSESALLPLTDNQFQMMVPGDDKILTSFSGKTQMELVIGESDPIISTRIESYTYNNEALQAFVGTFYCKALNTVYEFSIEAGNLTATNLKAGKVSFKPVKERLFEGDKWFFGSILFDKDLNGFNLQIEDVRKLKFIKI